MPNNNNKKIKLVLCWHMHQPEYRDLSTGEYILPWTYLHAIKDYVDMAAHLEAVPTAKVVVNFAPVLLEQIEDYARQLQDYLHDRIAIRDPLLAALVGVSIPSDPDDRLTLVKNCMRANRGRQIDRYPYFSRLVEMAEWLESHHDAIKYANSQFIADMLVWYHLSWLGEIVKKTDFRIKRLLEKGANYTLHERIEMAEVISELLASVILRYKALAKKGQVELSLTPYAHPIMPLLLDIRSAHQAMPEAPLPQMDNYPGGDERVRWHIQKGIQAFKRFFGFVPRAAGHRKAVSAERRCSCWPKPDSAGLPAAARCCRTASSMHQRRSVTASITPIRWTAPTSAVFFAMTGFRI